MRDPTAEQAQLRRLLLGWSLVCAEVLSPGTDVGRDLVLRSGPTGVDFATLEGWDNLRQALTVALTTLLGSDVFNTQFGFDGLNALAEETSPVLIRERIRVAIIQVLRKEPRIRRIVDVNLVNDRLQQPAAGDGSRTLQVQVAFETVSGETATLDLGKAVPGA